MFVRPSVILYRVIPFWLLAIVGICSAADGFRFPTEHITLEQWSMYLAEVKALPGVTIKEGGQQITITQQQPSVIIYSFTKPNNLAHPGVVIRELVKQDVGYFIDRKGYYAGDENEFERWWHAFDALDQKVKADLNGKVK